MRDRADDWEADIIDAFRDRSEMHSYAGDRYGTVGRSLVFATPIVARAACLACHGVPSAAPPGMVKLHGSDNGFHWKNDEVIGAEIVSVPLGVAETAAKASFTKLMLVLVAVALVILVVLGVLLKLTVITPINDIAGKADEISVGRIDETEIEAKGDDEIAGLARAFNRMARSLRKAMRLLETPQ